MDANAVDDAPTPVGDVPGSRGSGSTAPMAAPAQRLVEAAASCLARWGIAKTTVDDVAKAAGVSRATVYRYFEGKDHLVLAVALYEEGRCFAQIGPRLERTDTLEETLAVTLSEATRFLRDHDLLNMLLAHEPEAILPHLAFDRLAPLLYRTTSFLAPYLERHLEPAAVPAVAEWLTRLVLSYWVEPAPGLDPADPAGARHLVRRYLLPGLEADRLPTASPPAPPRSPSGTPIVFDPSAPDPTLTSDALTPEARTPGTLTTPEPPTDLITLEATP